MYKKKQEKKKDGKNTQKEWKGKNEETCELLIESTISKGVKIKLS